MSDPILAIDFGTSNSLVGSVYKGKKQLGLPIDPHNSDPSMMRTLLYFPNPDICYYGVDAIKQYLDHDMEGRLFRSFKSHLPNQAYLGTVFDNRILTLENMIGYFLLELKKRAENFLQQKIEHAIIGRPARYSMNSVADGFALYRMQKAADIAGFKKIQFVPEPLAAAFDYRKHITYEKIILIGDFGGGTSDFTIIKLHPNKFNKEDVLAIDGCPLAGDALDSCFMSHNLNEYFGAKSKYKMPLSDNVLVMPPSVMEKLNLPAHIVHLKEKETYEFIKEVKKCSVTGADNAAIERLFVLIEDNQVFSFFENIEKSKIELSQKQKSKFVFDYPDIEIETEFSIEQFNQWSQDTKNNIFAALDRCLNQANLKEDQIDLVCLTGGTSKVPMILSEFEKRFTKKKLQTQSQFHSVLSGLVEAASFWVEGIDL